MQVLHYSDRKEPNFIDLYKKCDMLITTGDLSRTDFGIFETLSHPKPAFGVYGNHDDGGTYLEDFEIINVHNKVVEYKDLKIGGFQGCPKYTSRDMQFTEDEAKSFADTLLSRTWIY